jgi:hypothetical protein
MSTDIKMFVQCDHYADGKQYTYDMCPKCFGKGYYYDISFDSTGNPILATGTIKLQQEVLKIINDVRGNNLFFERWGSTIHDIIGSKMTNMPMAKCEMAVRMCLDYLKTLQQMEHEMYDNMTSDEILLDVESINSTQFSRGYDIAVTIKNQSNEIYDQTIYTE